MHSYFHWIQYTTKSQMSTVVLSEEKGSSKTIFIVVVIGHEKKALYYQEIMNIFAILELQHSDPILII